MFVYAYKNVVCADRVVAIFTKSDLGHVSKKVEKPVLESTYLIVQIKIVKDRSYTHVKGVHLSCGKTKDLAVSLICCKCTQKQVLHT